MNEQQAQDYVQRCITTLATNIGARPAGTAANRAAAQFIMRELAASGWDTDVQSYPCPDWQARSCTLTVDDTLLPAAANTFSPAGSSTAPLVPLSDAAQAGSAALAGRIALLHGPLLSDPFLPANFNRAYYTMEEQDAFLRAVLAQHPAALICVSPHAAVPPVFIEDDTITVPSATVTRTVGEQLLAARGLATLTVSSTRRESTGANLIARRPGTGDKPVLLSAHYDTKPDTPGALDNAAGVAALLLAARDLAARPGPALELVFFGGEDSWWPGDEGYILAYPPMRVCQAINLDGIGYRDRPTALALFNYDEPASAALLALVKAAVPCVTEPFYASDHGFFWPHGVPTIALTSSGLLTAVGTEVHTAADVPALVDAGMVARLASLLPHLMPGG